MSYDLDKFLDSYSNAANFWETHYFTSDGKWHETQASQTAPTWGIGTLQRRSRINSAVAFLRNVADELTVQNPSRVTQSRFYELAKSYYSKVITVFNKDCISPLKIDEPVFIDRFSQNFEAILIPENPPKANINPPAECFRFYDLTKELQGMIISLLRYRENRRVWVVSKTFSKLCMRYAPWFHTKRQLRPIVDLRASPMSFSGGVILGVDRIFCKTGKKSIFERQHSAIVDNRGTVVRYESADQLEPALNPSSVNRPVNSHQIIVRTIEKMGLFDIDQNSFVWEKPTAGQSGGCVIGQHVLQEADEQFVLINATTNQPLQYRIASFNHSGICYSDDTIIVLIRKHTEEGGRIRHTLHQWNYITGEQHEWTLPYPHLIDFWLKQTAQFEGYRYPSLNKRESNKSQELILPVKANGQNCLCLLDIKEKTSRLAPGSTQYNIGAIYRFSDTLLLVETLLPGLNPATEVARRFLVWNLATGSVTDCFGQPFVKSYQSTDEDGVQYNERLSVMQLNGNLIAICGVTEEEHTLSPSSPLKRLYFLFRNAKSEVIIHRYLSPVRHVEQNGNLFAIFPDDREKPIYYQIKP